MNRFDAVRELVKDPSLRVTDIAKQTGYNKGHVSRLRKEAMKNSSDFECPRCGHCCKTDLAKVGEVGVWGEWVGLTAYEIQEIYSGNQHWGNFACAIEAKLKEKNKW